MLGRMKEVYAVLLLTHQPVFSVIQVCTTCRFCRRLLWPCLSNTPSRWVNLPLWCQVVWLTEPLGEVEGQLGTGEWHCCFQGTKVHHHSLNVVKCHFVLLSPCLQAVKGGLEWWVVRDPDVDGDVIHVLPWISGCQWWVSLSTEYVRMYVSLWWGKAF